MYMYKGVYSTLHADSPLSAKLRGKFKLCEETHGGHYLGHSQNSAELINFLGGTLVVMTLH